MYVVSEYGICILIVLLIGICLFTAAAMLVLIDEVAGRLTNALFRAAHYVAAFEPNATVSTNERFCEMSYRRAATSTCSANQRDAHPTRHSGLRLLARACETTQAVNGIVKPRRFNRHRQEEGHEENSAQHRSVNGLRNTFVCARSACKNVPRSDHG